VPVRFREEIQTLLRRGDCELNPAAQYLRSGIPFSVELRWFFVRYEQRLQSKSDLIFATRDGQPVARRTVNRDLHRLCRNLNIEEPSRIVHALRHSFAIGSLRAGASTLHVMRMLGHTSVAVTQKYCNLQTEDLSAVHQRVSLLAP
jgi:integrase/recombinase XerD